MPRCSAGAFCRGRCYSGLSPYLYPAGGRCQAALPAYVFYINTLALSRQLYFTYRYKEKSLDVDLGILGIIQLFSRLTFRQSP